MATSKELQVLFLQRSTARKTLLASLLASSLLTGCQRRAHTDLYVDSMAAEIRDLEDQLYQYDHEYRLLEQELESLRRRKMQNGQYDLIAPLEVVPKQKNNEPKASPDNKLKTPGSDSGSQPKAESSPATPPSSSQTPASPPSILNNPQPFQFPAPSSDNLPAPNRTTTPGNGAGSSSGAPTNGNSSKSESTDIEFNAGELIVPTITTGALTPPSLDVGQRSATPEKDLELSLSQIELPSQLTGGRNNSAKITTAVQVVTDKRIVELAFHPALSRAVSFDDDNKDDGLYLVLQPKNEQGQVVAITGAITVEVFDPTRDAKNAIGRWSYSAIEIEGKIQPIGSKQGIHLTLPWNGPNPKSDRVVVTVTMQLENGRKVIGKREIFLNSGNGLKTVWTPRANRAEVQSAAGVAPAANGRQLQGLPDSSSAVIRASAEFTDQKSSGSIHSGGHPVQSVGSYPAPESAPLPQFER
ncbi:MAG: hypothetical protein U0930_18035 [Pirellulales bacterium]